MRSSGEFELIARHFTALGARRDDVVLGVGDDAALLAAGHAHRIAVAWDSVALEPHDDPHAAGEDCAEAVLRRLVQEGACPAWMTLALSMDTPGDAWAAAFSGGVHAACARHGASLVGGDTTSGPLTATLFATGRVQDG